MRDPNGPIPGFEEYTGTVGKEKKLHKNTFLVPEKTWRSTGENERSWYKIGVGKYKLLNSKEAKELGLERRKK